MGVLTVLCPTYIQDYLFTDICPCAERGKRGFDYDEQKVEGSSSSPQLRTKGSEGRTTERGDRKD